MAELASRDPEYSLRLTGDNGDYSFCPPPVSFKRVDEDDFSTTSVKVNLTV
jgi:hypothetical protein